MPPTRETSSTHSPRVTIQARAAADAVAAAQAEVDRLHAALRDARREAAPRFAAAVATELAGVGLGEGEFRVELRETDAGPSGADEARFTVRPNAGLPFGPVAETASGGELSRIALAIAAVAGGETMVFDEIDAGVGGETAHAVGETLRRLAGRAQVITITHLPQIASLADRHFRVEKVAGDPTHTRIEPLAADDRRDELERMLGGADFLATLARMKAASRELLASRADAWGFLAEPYHLSDWWPGMLSVEPDRRGFAAGARWQVAVFADPLRLGPLRFPQVGRPAGPSARQTLVIVAIEPFERWEWNLIRRLSGPGERTATRSVEVRLASGRARPHGGDRVGVRRHARRLPSRADGRRPPLRPRANGGCAVKRAPSSAPRRIVRVKGMSSLLRCNPVGSFAGRRILNAQGGPS